MSEHIVDRLSDYLDEELSSSEREVVRAHLAGCAECARVRDELQGVIVAARRLDADALPADLWTGVTARLEPRPRKVISLVERLSRIPRRLDIGIPQLAAAGLALMLLSGGAVWLAMRGSAPSQIAVQRPTGSIAARTPDVQPPAAEPAPSGRSARTPRPFTPQTTDAAVAAFDERRYDAAVGELESALRDHGSELDTTTVRILLQNLAIIDQAIDQARRALAADPANPYLNGHLADQLRRKVKLLQRATGAVAAQG